MTASGKPKKDQVYLAVTFHCPSSANSRLVVVMMMGFGVCLGFFFFYNPKNQKLLLLKTMLGFSPSFTGLAMDSQMPGFKPLYC